MSVRVVCVGLATLDTILRVPRLPRSGERLVADELVTAGGGPAATAAVTLARLGVETAFVGVVGEDEAGAVVRDGLAAAGVDVSELALLPGARSPRSTILVERAPGERAIVHFPGDAPPLELGAGALALCREAAWVHVDHAGYGAARAALRDVRLSVDGGNPIPGLDLAGVALYSPTEEALRETFGDAQAALAAGAELVVVTRGAAGSSAFATGREPVDAPGVEVKTVSTLGAGDVFHGALLARLVQGAPLPDALRDANLAAALSCRALDGRSAVPTADQLERSAGWATASQ